MGGLLDERASAAEEQDGHHRRDRRAAAAAAAAARLHNLECAGVRAHRRREATSAATALSALTVTWSPVASKWWVTRSKGPPSRCSVVCDFLLCRVCVVCVHGACAWCVCAWVFMSCVHGAWHASRLVDA